MLLTTYRLVKVMSPTNDRDQWQVARSVIPLSAYWLIWSPRLFLDEPFSSEQAGSVPVFEP